MHGFVQNIENIAKSNGDFRRGRRVCPRPRRRKQKNSDTCSGRSKCRPREPGTLAGSTRPTPGSAASSRLLPGLTFSADGVLQHLPVQRQVRHQLPQPPILVLELLQPRHLRRQQAVVPLLPVGYEEDSNHDAVPRRQGKRLGLMSGNKMGGNGE